MDDRVEEFHLVTEGIWIEAYSVDPHPLCYTVYTRHDGSQHAITLTSHAVRKLRDWLNANVKD